MSDLLDRLERALESDGMAPVISTGFPALDQVTGGLVGRRLYLVEGPSTTAKRNLALAIARHVAKCGMPVLYASAQLSVDEIAERVVAAEARISPKGLEDRHPKESDWSLLREAIGRLGDSPLYIAELARTDASELEELIAATGGQGDGCLVIAEAFGLPRAGSTKPAAASRSMIELRRLARLLNIPIIALVKSSLPTDGSASSEQFITKKWGDSADTIMIIHERAGTQTSRRPVVLTVVNKQHLDRGLVVKLYLEERHVEQPSPIDVPLAF